MCELLGISGNIPATLRLSLMKIAEHGGRTGPHKDGVSVVKITDFELIARFGIVSTPGIVIDGKIVHAGGLPKSEDLQRWLQA